MPRFECFSCCRGVRKRLPAHHSVRHSVAIDDAYCDEPTAIDLPKNCHPIEFESVIILRLIGPDPALLDPRFPVEIDVLRVDEPLRQTFGCAAPEFYFEPRDGSVAMTRFFATETGRKMPV